MVNALVLGIENTTMMWILSEVRGRSCVGTWSRPLWNCSSKGATPDSQRRKSMYDYTGYGTGIYREVWLMGCIKTKQFLSFHDSRQKKTLVAFHSDQASSLEKRETIIVINALLHCVGVEDWRRHLLKSFLRILIIILSVRHHPGLYCFPCRFTLIQFSLLLCLVCPLILDLFP